MKTILGTMTFGGQVDRQLADEMISSFRQAGKNELDTAFVYHKGDTELLLGQLNADARLAGMQVAGKANPVVEGGLSADSIKRQLTTSLNRLGLPSLDLFYLHSPDLNVPIRESLQAIEELHQQGLFKRFGLSNYAAWQVAEIVEICRTEGWVIPSVYQGMYNALTRDVERELLLCLENYSLAFYVYNPLAGGLLSGKYLSVDTLPGTGRFASFDGYQARYWKPEYFEAVNRLAALCREHDVELAAAALRWLVHHSALATKEGKQSKTTSGHGVIIGASSLSHFQLNLNAMTQAPLPEILTDAFNEGWDVVRPACIKYFRP